MNRTIGLISANYTFSGYDTLTEERPVASMPFGGRFRLLDFPLSNMVNSRIQTVGLITPYFYRSIMDHVGAGKEWDLDRKQGGLYILPGAAYGFRDPNARFLFRDILRNQTYFRRGDGDYFLFSSGTLVANIDYEPMIAQHEIQGRGVTFLYKKMAPGQKHNGFYLQLDDSGAVKSMARADSGENLFLNSFIIDKSLLLKLFRDYEAVGHMDLIEILLEVLPVTPMGSYRFNGYVGFMRGKQEYFRSSMDLLRNEIRQELFPRDRQIITKIHDAPPALYLPGSRVRNSVMTAGSVIEGRVDDSVLFRGVRIEKGASVKNCVLMEGCVIEPGAHLENVICDKAVTVTAGTIIRGTDDSPCVLPKGGVI